MSNILAKGVTCNHSNADGLTPLHRVSRLLYLMYIYYVLKHFNCNQMNSNESSVITLSRHFLVAADLLDEFLLACIN